MATAQEKQAHSYHFFMKLSDDVCIRFTVYSATDTGTEIHYSQQEANRYRPHPRVAGDLLNRLTVSNVDTKPNPTTTLILYDWKDVRGLRIDSQPANSVFRNIHIQCSNLTFAVTTIDEAGEFIFGEFKCKLLKYLKNGLKASLENKSYYRIIVKTEKRKRDNWEEIKLKKNDPLWKTLEAWKKKYEEKMKNVSEKKLTLAKNTHMINNSNAMILQVVGLIEKNVTKLAEKEGEHIAAKKIPITSTFVGAFLGVQRAKKGDFARSFAAVASGILADFPGGGTADSSAIDVDLMAKDLAEIIQNEEREKQFLEDEVKALKEENLQIQKELNEILPESPIYGLQRGEFYTESELAYVDDICKIHARVKDDGTINAIQVEYKLGGKGGYHGGQEGMLHTLSLAPDEYITTVEVNASSDAISGIKFCTDYCQEATFGRVGEEPDIYGYNVFVLVHFTHAHWVKDNSNHMDYLP